jgi:hypothetical protein
MLELSFNERVRRAVNAYDLAGGYYDSKVHWCDECGFVPNAQFHGHCGERYHYADEAGTVECKHGDVDERWIDKPFVADKMHELLSEHVENQEEELVEELFAVAQEIVAARVSVE